MIDQRVRVLRMLAETGTVTATARALGYTPSAVSHQLGTLSRELGVKLIEPVGRGVRLTPAAVLLCRRSDDLQALWEEIRGEIARVGNEERAELRLCGFSTASAALLPTVAAIVAKKHPHCKVRIIEADPEECFSMLLAERADLALVVATPNLPPASDPRFDQRPLLQDPIDLLVPEGHPLADQATVYLRDAATEDWILDRPGRPHHRLVVNACAEAGFRPTGAHEAADWDTGAALVDAGLGVALLPRLARLPEGYGIVRVPLAGEPAPVRHVLTGIRRGSGEQPVIAAALDALSDTVASWSAEAAEAI